jgi:tetratricopeptide (TPR) repeat protein
MAAARTFMAAGEPFVAQARGDDSDWKQLEAYRRNVHMDVLGWDEHYAEELALADDTHAWLRSLPAADEGRLWHVVAAAEAYAAQNEAYYYLGRKEKALDVAEVADRMLASAAPRFPNDAALLGERLFSGYNVITSREALRRREGLLDLSLRLAEVAKQVRALEPNDRVTVRRARLADELAAQYLALAGRRGEAIAIQSRLVSEGWRRHLASPSNARVIRDYATDAKILGEIHWEGGDHAPACGLWRKALPMLLALEKRGHLNDWDKTNLLAGLRRDVEICDGRHPESAYRGGNI